MSQDCKYVVQSVDQVPSGYVRLKSYTRDESAVLSYAAKVGKVSGYSVKQDPNMKRGGQVYVHKEQADQYLLTARKINRKQTEPAPETKQQPLLDNEKNVISQPNTVFREFLMAKLNRIELKANKAGGLYPRMDQIEAKLDKILNLIEVAGFDLTGPEQEKGN